MRKLKLILSILIFVATLSMFQMNSYCITEHSMIKLAATGNDITPDDVMSEADAFISQGEAASDIDKELLGDTSSMLYNLLLGIGIIAAVGVGIALGIKYMVGSIDERAELKQALLGYVVSCVVIFGAFGIWKLVINILSSL